MEKRLQTILSHAGAASRRGAASLIEEGSVKVDGQVVREKGLRVDPDKHEILVRGVPLKSEEKKLYFLLNKPANVISTVKDTHGRKNIMDIFTGIKARLYPVGRLDKDTTGVIIVTNDGDLAHKLSHPSFETDKEYLVRTRYPLEERDLKKISSGVEIDGKMTSPCKIKTIKDGSYGVRLHEGRKRQIKKMFESVGNRVLELDRVRYAGLSAAGLARGEYRELTPSEIKGLKRPLEKNNSRESGGS
jgi:23S rRNA pseudouridine2605 synthase